MKRLFHFFLGKTEASPEVALAEPPPISDVSDDPFEKLLDRLLRTEALDGALADTRFAGTAPPREDGWRPMASAPTDATPVWSRNALMPDAVISRRARGVMHLVLAAPFDPHPAGLGGKCLPDRWQPLVAKGPRP